jgi:arsenite methyltransferase
VPVKKTESDDRRNLPLFAPAISEIVRVLKFGGQVALMDFKHVGQYCEDLKKNGVGDASASGPIFWIFPPVRVARGHKS